MIADQTFDVQIAAALAAVRARIAARLRTEVPQDVAVHETGDGVALTGRALAARALDDPRLRDLAAVLR